MSYGQNQLLTYGSFLCPTPHLSFALVTASKESSLIYGLGLEIDAPAILHPQEKGSKKGSVRFLKMGTKPFGQNIPTVWICLITACEKPEWGL